MTPETKREKRLSEPIGRLCAEMTAYVHEHAGLLVHTPDCAAVVEDGLLAPGDDVYIKARFTPDPLQDFGSVGESAQGRSGKGKYPAARQKLQYSAEAQQDGDQLFHALLGERAVLHTAGQPGGGLAAERLAQTPVLKRIYDEPYRVRAYIYNAVQMNDPRFEQYKQYIV